MIAFSSDQMLPWLYLRSMLDKLDQSFPSSFSAVAFGSLAAFLLLWLHFLWFLIGAKRSRWRFVSFFWKNRNSLNLCPFHPTRLQRLVQCHLFFVEKTVVKFVAKHLPFVEAMPVLWTIHFLLVNEQSFLLFRCRQGSGFLRHVSTDYWLNYQGYQQFCSPQTPVVFYQLHATIAKQLSNPLKRS